jgi:hypothetical protein
LTVNAEDIPICKLTEVHSSFFFNFFLFFEKIGGASLAPKLLAFLFDTLSQEAALHSKELIVLPLQV